MSLSATNITCGALDQDMVIYSEQQASATAGGTYTSGSFAKRILNTTVYSRQTWNNTWSSLDTVNYQITLNPGVYLVEAWIPAYFVEVHCARLQNITDGTTDLVSSSYSGRIGGTTQQQSTAHIYGVLTVSGSSKVYEVQNRCTTTQASNGLGIESSIDTNTYTIIKILKLE